MSLKSAPYYWLRCDGCGEYSGYNALSSPAKVVDLALEAGWSMQGERHHCPECPPLDAEAGADQ